MKTIIAPTDFSDNATNAVRYAAALAHQVKAKLVIVHIINLPSTPIEYGTPFLPCVQLEEGYAQELNRLSKGLQLSHGFGLEIETDCQYGHFLANLNETVKAKAADLVVMGTKGVTNFLDKLMGTNTSLFIRMMACPVLAIPSDAVFSGIRNIAYASGFDCGETIPLQRLFRIAEPLQAEVSIINVQTESQSNIFCDNHVIRDIAKNFPDKDLSIAQIQGKDIVGGLHQFMQDKQAEVLAVSIHMRSFFESLFHRSISGQLIASPSLPLLALPDKPYRKLYLKAKTEEIILEPAE
ncbi:universal stress protein [Rufibacter hautae]|uniref:Universal stress protein n=1 Tax=Rufibacter hautae TaxID=2595005 RepID=A0A5B6T7E4_9BACT|nr:universal stress protein [Rufibacter hautae]KAA3435945.1 universal stress protein [Rufibacter hautae]